MKLALTHKSYCRGILFHILYLFNYIVIVLEQAGILVSPRSQSARDPSETKFPVSPRSQSAQDPSQPWMPSCLFGSCLFGIWLMPIWYLAYAYRGSPTYTKITNTVSTTTIFGLCTCKWRIFMLAQISCNTFFFLV